MAASKPSVRIISAFAGPRLLGPRLTVRQLSMTGSTASSSLLTTDKPYASNRSAGPIRLHGEQTIPVPEATETGNKVRRFNTSRSLKSVGDSSTLDFMHFPEFDLESRSAPMGIRVPIIPWANVASRGAESEDSVSLIPIHGFCLSRKSANDMLLRSPCSPQSTPSPLTVPTSTPLPQ